MSTATPQVPPLDPPHLLEGQVLPGGWIVGTKVAKQPGSTGGNFSVGYECTSQDGRTAFLKAIDLYKAMEPPADVIKTLGLLAEEVQSEKDLLEQCRRMDRVVTVIEHGDLRELSGEKLKIVVPYIIFERAEETARSVVQSTKRPCHGWCLRTLHHVAVGLWQMHGRMIAHQDVKLSNVLIFPKENTAKISDLGRSVQQGRSVPHDQMEWPGDWGYAPPEFCYGYTPPEFNTRRLAADLYLLGSCACSIFTGVSINGILYDELPADFRPRAKHGTFTGTFIDVLPHLKDAFERVLNRVGATIPHSAPYRDEMVTMIREWCEPNPGERGHPITRGIIGPGGNIYSLERYLTRLDVLAKKAAIFDSTLSKG